MVTEDYSELINARHRHKMKFLPLIEIVSPSRSPRMSHEGYWKIPKLKGIQSSQRGSSTIQLA
jgi:hypothetical protein